MKVGMRVLISGTAMLGEIAEIKDRVALVYLEGSNTSKLFGFNEIEQILPSARPKFHVLVSFGPGISADAQGRAMLAMEIQLRELTAAPVEVFKETMGDDSKLRRAMTPEQRARL